MPSNDPASKLPSGHRLALDVALATVAVVVAVAVVAVPLAAGRYPPIIDLPFHAAQTGALRHYFDPAYHFQEQFELRPFVVPYLSMYVIGALLMLAFSAVTAVKIAAGTMLLLLPAGLAVMLHGMKKSPLLGLSGLIAVWGPLTHWGFLNFLGATGLFAMVVGLSLLVVERLTRRRLAALAAVLVAVFFTHVYRYPFAIAAVVGAGLVAGRRGRGLQAVAPVVFPAIALLAVWMKVRPAALRGSMGPPHLDLGRLHEIVGWQYGAFDDPDEGRALAFFAATLAAVAVSSGILRAIERRSPRWVGPAPEDRARAALVALGCAGASLLLFVTLPMAIGDWWYVYPRESTVACFLALALIPDLPRTGVLRAALVGAMAVAPLPMVAVVTRSYAAFDEPTRDFDTITRGLPLAPRLLYLIFEHSGSNRTVSPFIHLPAYVQAELGGALSYHFAIYGASPLAYRPREGRESIVPPPTPPSWESRPEAFDVLDRGRFFDWFLVRRRDDPAPLFEADPSIVLDRHVGLWWLYRRVSDSDGVGLRAGVGP